MERNADVQVTIGHFFVKTEAEEYNPCLLQMLYRLLRPAKFVQPRANVHIATGHFFIKTEAEIHSLGYSFQEKEIHHEETKSTKGEPKAQ